MSRLLLLAALGVALRAPTARAEDGFCAAPLATGEAADCASPALRRAPLPLPLSVDSALLSSWITRLANFSDSPAPAVTRLVYTAQDLAARSYVKELMVGEGLVVREDSFGTIFGRWVGSAPAEPAVATGSHTDAIPLAGRFDGVLGVVGPLAAVGALRRAGFAPRRSIDVLMFSSEEPTRFGLGCTGSRAMAGALSAEALAGLKDSLSNATFAEVVAAAGFGGAHGEAQMLEAARVAAGTYASFVELHIEQGPRLEAAGLPIGVVTAVAAPASLTLDFYGDGGHAGSLLMGDRHDAGLAAAEVALFVEAAALSTGAPDTVATTGVLTLEPGAVNSVPRHAHMTVDVRDVEGPRRDGVVDAVLATARRVAARRGVRLEEVLLNRDPPATAAPQVVAALEEAASALGLPTMRLVSRAYHDTLFMAQLAPSGMVFIPCRGGFSHRPDEFASDQAMKDGVAVLALALARLSSD